MPQEPTGNNARPVHIVKNFRGLNDQRDTVFRPDGTVTDGRNTIDAPINDAVRRPGRDLVSLDDGNAVGVIYQLSWPDGGVTVIQQTGDEMSFDEFEFPNQGLVTPTLTDPSTPGPYPAAPQFPPFNNQGLGAGIPDLVPMIRALSEAYLFATNGVGTFNWASRRVRADFYDSNGSLVASTREKAEYIKLYNQGYRPRPVFSTEIPATVILGIDMQLDNYWVDYISMGPIAWITDLNDIISRYNTTILVLYSRYPVEGQTTITLQNPADAFGEVAAKANFAGVASRFSAAVNAKTRYLKVTATQVETEERVGEAGIVGCAALYVTYPTISVSGYFIGFFDITGGVCTGCGAFPPVFATTFTGSMTADVGAPTNCGWNSATPDPPIGGSTPIATCTYNSSTGNWIFVFYFYCDLGGGSYSAGSKEYTKVGGSDPTGVYSQSGGQLCAGDPATITIIP